MRSPFRIAGLPATGCPGTTAAGGLAFALELPLAVPHLERKERALVGNGAASVHEALGTHGTHL